MYSADELKKLQGLQLKIAKEFKRICDKYQISYSLSGGSLLGAIRHTGFIPWDDDFDVEMLRSEYVLSPVSSWRGTQSYEFPS